MYTRQPFGLAHMKIIFYEEGLLPKLHVLRPRFEPPKSESIKESGCVVKLNIHVNPGNILTL